MKNMQQQRLFKGRKPDPDLESIVLRQAKGYLKARGIYYLRLNSGSAKKGAHYIELCPENTPDLLIAYRGVVFFAEAKREGEDVRQTQLEHHRLMRDHYHLPVIVFRDVEGLADFLKEIDEAAWHANGEYIAGTTEFIRNLVEASKLQAA